MLEGAYFFALVSACFFGLALVLTQFGLRYLPPLRGASISIPTTTVLFLIGSLFIVDWSEWELRAAAIFAAVGCLFPIAATVLTFQGNRSVGPNIAGAVGNLAPLFAVLFAIVFLGELPGLGHWVGIAAIVLGVTVMTMSRGKNGNVSWPLIALLLPLAAALVRGLIQPAVKLGLSFWHSPFAAVTIGYVVSAVLVLTIVRLRSRSDTEQTDWRGAAWFAAVGFCNGTAVLMMYMALGRGPVAVVAALVATYPVATLFLSSLLLRDMRLNGGIVLGVAVTVGGVALLMMR